MFNENIIKFQIWQKLLLLPKYNNYIKFAALPAEKKLILLITQKDIEIMLKESYSHIRHIDTYTYTYTYTCTARRRHYGSGNSATSIINPHLVLTSILLKYLHAVYVSVSLNHPQSTHYFHIKKAKNMKNKLFFIQKKNVETLIKRLCNAFKALAFSLS